MTHSGMTLVHHGNYGLADLAATNRRTKGQDIDTSMLMCMMRQWQWNTEAMPIIHNGREQEIEGESGAADHVRKGACPRQS